MKRRTMLMFGLPAAAVALMVYGIAKREWALSALQGVATKQAALPVEIITPQPGSSTRPLVLARHGSRLVRSTDLRTGRGICAQLERGLRRDREGGTAAGDDRHAEFGCAVRGCEGSSRSG